MLRISSRILRATKHFNRQLSYNAARCQTTPSTNIVTTNFVNRLSSDLEQLRITTPTSPSSKIEINDAPFVPRIIENPRDVLITEIRDILNGTYQKIIEAPNNASTNNNEIQAARLIVIRRRKMKKHKLRKLRKKMKFEWAKVRQRREMRKEKRFQAGLLHRIKLAEQFSAEQYVAEKLRQANETPIPRYWKGKRLPQFIIKEKMGIK